MLIDKEKLLLSLFLSYLYISTRDMDDYLWPKEMNNDQGGAKRIQY